MIILSISPPLTDFTIETSEEKQKKVGSLAVLALYVP